MIRVSLFLVAVFILLLQTPFPVSSGATKTEFSIVYTNDVMGEVEPCG